MALIKRTYNPMQGVVTFKTIDSQLIQEYDVDNRVYTPDRRIVPTVVQPIVQVNDPAGLVPNGIKNAQLAPEYIKYYENEPKSANEILDSNSNYHIDRTSTNDNRGRITIRKNVDAENPVTIVFEAVFADKVGDKIRRRLPVIGSFVLTTNVASQSPLVLIEDYPRGRIFNPLKDFAHMKLSADLYSGEEIIPSAFWWYKVNGSNETLLDETYEGHNLREVKIPSIEIGKEQRYKVKVQDCRKDLNTIRNDFLQTELDKNTIQTPDGAVVLNNEVINSTFMNDLANWSLYPKYESSAISIDGNYIKSYFPSAAMGFSQKDIALNNNDKVYVSVTMKSDIQLTVAVGFAKSGVGVNTPITSIVGNSDTVINGIIHILDSNINSFVVGRVLSPSSYVYLKKGALLINLTQTFGAGNEPAKEQMGVYLADKPYITNTEDLIAEMNKIQLPTGYRPSTIRIDKEAEMTLSTRYPQYDVRVVTDYGDDASIIEIPSDVHQFDAWVEIHTANGVVENLADYFNIDWGGGKTGERITVDADDLGLELYTLEPTVTEKI